MAAVQKYIKWFCTTFRVYPFNRYQEKYNLQNMESPIRNNVYSLWCQKYTKMFLSHTELNGDQIVFQHVKMDVNAMGMKSLKFGDDTLLRGMTIFL